MEDFLVRGHDLACKENVVPMKNTVSVTLSVTGKGDLTVKRNCTLEIGSAVILTVLLS